MCVVIVLLCVCCDVIVMCCVCGVDVLNIKLLVIKRRFCEGLSVDVVDVVCCDVRNCLYLLLCCVVRCDWDCVCVLWVMLCVVVEDVVV